MRRTHVWKRGHTVRKALAAAFLCSTMPNRTGETSLSSCLFEVQRAEKGGNNDFAMWDWKTNFALEMFNEGVGENATPLNITNAAGKLVNLGEEVGWSGLD